MDTNWYQNRYQNWYQNSIDSMNIRQYESLNGLTYRFDDFPTIFVEKERSNIMYSIKFLVDKNDYEELKEELLEVKGIEINRRFMLHEDERYYCANLDFVTSPEQEINVRLNLFDPRGNDEYALPVYDGDLNNILNTFFIRLEGDAFVTPINQGVEFNGSSLNNLITRGSDIDHHLRSQTETNMLLSLFNPDLHAEQIPWIAGIDSLEWPLVELSFRMGLSVDQDNLIDDYEKNKDSKEEIYGLMVEYIEGLYKLLDYPIEIHQANGGTQSRGDRGKTLQEVVDYLDSEFFNESKTIFLHLKNKDQYNIILENVITGLIKRGEDHSGFKHHSFSDFDNPFNDDSFIEGYYMLTRGFFSFFSLLDSEMMSEEALNDVSAHSIDVINGVNLNQSFSSKFSMLQEIIEEKRIPSPLQN